MTAVTGPRSRSGRVLPFVRSDGRVLRSPRQAEGEDCPEMSSRSRCAPMADHAVRVPPLPEDPGERRKIATHLVILAALGLATMIISAIAE
jgi:hypothetical protein